MTAFQPLGERSRRNVVIDTLGNIQPGVLMTYDELMSLLGVDKRTCQSVVNQAKSGLEKQYKKAVVAVPNEGYRVVYAKEHLDLAKAHQKRAGRQLRKSHSKAVNVEFSQLTDGERAAITLAAAGLALQMEYMRRNDIRSSRLESAVEVVKSSQARSDGEIAELKSRLARLEGQ